MVLLILFVVAEAALLANDAALDSLAWRTTRWVMGDQDAYGWGAYKHAHEGEANAPFYQRVDPPMTKKTADPKKEGIEARLYTRTEKFWRLFRDLGEPEMAVILVAVVIVFDRRRWKAGVMLGVAVGAAGAAGMLIRAVTGRLRPDGKLLDDSLRPVQDALGHYVRNEGGNHWYFFRGFSFDASDLAFPSGHATIAFATAAVLSFLAPKGRVLFFTLAALCALTRVVMQAHFYSDALMGAAVGLTIGYVLVRWLDRVGMKREE